MKSIWQHQTNAHHWTIDRRESLLSMGSGKTRAVLELLRSWQPKRVLVCCPKSVIPVRLKQVTMWGLDSRVLLLNSGSSAKTIKQLIQALADTRPLIGVVNYESVWRLPLIEGSQWDVLVYDEVHRLKRHSGKTSRWAARMNAKNPTAKKPQLSGTLLARSILGAYQVIESSECQTFGFSWTFYRCQNSYSHIQILGMILRWLNTDEFSEKFNTTTFQVNTTDAISLPEKMHETIDVELSAKEDATVGRSDASRSSCARRKWSGVIRKGRPRTMPGDGNCGPTTTQGSQTMMRGCSEKYFLEGCYD